MRRVAAVLLLAAACAGAPPSPFAVSDLSALDEMRAAAAAPGAPAAFRLFVTGDTRGFLAPCGCESGQRGGIARRKTYLDAVARPGDLRIDLGNVALGSGAAAHLRMKSTFVALGSMGYAMFVPARAEVLAGTGFITASRPGNPMLTDLSCRVVCANIVDPDGERPFEATLVHTLPDGRRVGVVGVTGRIRSPGFFGTTDPSAAVRAAIASLEGRADAFVVAASMPWEEARVLADALDGVALVVGGMAPEGPAGAASGARTPLVATGPRGEHVLRVDFDATLRPASAWRSWLDEGIADDAPMADLVLRHRRELSDLDPNYVPDVLAGLTGRGFVGTETCIDCHAEDHEAWNRSAHAHAMTTLVAKEASRDPECVPCHLVDVAAAEGTPRKPDDLGVGCEACHGGARRHVESARRGDRPPATTAYPAKLDDCRACHRPPEVTRFDAAEAWPKIVHGKR